MNKLPVTKRTQIIQLLVEGTSLRTISRIADVSVNTVTKLLVDVGKACQDFHDVMVVGVNSQRVQCDKVRSFYAKENNIEEAVVASNDAGDVWMWTGLDANTKLIVSWYMGNQDAESAYEFIQDIKSRINNRVQLTTDGYNHYLEAVDERLGSDINLAQISRIYGYTEGICDEKQHSSAACGDVIQKPVVGRPDAKHVSIPCIERQSITMGVHMCRFTRISNAFSKKIENHCYAVALHFVYYNFCKVHKALRVTPAMEAGLTERLMEIWEIAELTPNGALRVRDECKKNIAS